MKGQIWVETVVYTLIGLAIIGAILAIALPKINSMKDKRVVDQSVAMMEDIDSKVKEILDNGPGNSRKIEITLKRGYLKIKPIEDIIEIQLKNIRNQYSEIGGWIHFGNVLIKTEKKQRNYDIFLMLNYSEIANLSFNGDFINEGSLTYSSKPYNLLIKNNGGELINVDFEEVR